MVLGMSASAGCCAEEAPQELGLTWSLVWRARGWLGCVHSCTQGSPQRQQRHREMKEAQIDLEKRKKLERKKAQCWFHRSLDKRKDLSEQSTVAEHNKVFM